MKTDLLNKAISMEISKEQESALHQVLIENAIRFFSAGGTISLGEWQDLTKESQDVLIEARAILAQAMLEATEPEEQNPVPEAEKAARESTGMSIGKQG
jgi:ABC-type branched-subunit amino acid transport system substrate-binding protein